MTSPTFEQPVKFLRRALHALSLLGGMLWSSVVGAAPTWSLVDIASDSGLTHSLDDVVSEACDDGRTCGLTWTGAVAAEDIDRDGDIDLYFSGGVGPGVLYQNQVGVFVDITGAAGLEAVPSAGGVALLDIDGDGDRDLVINPISNSATSYFRPYLFISDAAARPTGAVPSFVEAGVSLGLETARALPTSGMGVSAGDYDRDGSVDLFFADWRERVTDCNAAGARLYRGVRGLPGTFTHASPSAGVWAPRRGETTFAFSFGSAFTDLDGDRRPDLLVISDFESTTAYWGADSGRFLQDDGNSGLGSERTGMGSTIADYDNDGDLDVFVSAIFETDHRWDGNRLYRNEGSRRFTDQTNDAGVRDTGWGWGAAFTDLDNDGDVDLAVTSGVEAGYAAPPGYADGTTHVFINPGGPGPWDDVSTEVGVPTIRSGRTLIPLDVDADGDEDLLIVQHQGPPVLLRNDGGNANDFLTVRVIGAAGNLDALGARVRVLDSLGRQQMREIGTRDHFLGHGPRVAHFGLGSGFAAALGTLTVSVDFVDGRTVTLGGLAPNQHLVVDGRALLPPTSSAQLLIPPANDCDADDYPDLCQPDCNAEGTPDVCELLQRPALDCDQDGVIDACVLALGLALDCDSDRRIDSCAIQAGEQLDCNTDGIPDVCQVSATCAEADAGAPPPFDQAVTPAADAGTDTGLPPVRVSPPGGCSAAAPHQTTRLGWYAVLLFAVAALSVRRSRTTEA
jgi:hypothetical protein